MLGRYEGCIRCGALTANSSTSRTSNATLFYPDGSSTVRLLAGLHVLS